MFATTIVGSLPKPHWLAEPTKLWAPWQLAGGDLETAKRDATILALKLQEDCGIDLVADAVEEWGIAALHRASEGLSCRTAVHICYGYGIKANIDWKATLGTEWRQYEEIFPALAKSRIGQVSLQCRNPPRP